MLGFFIMVRGEIKVKYDEQNGKIQKKKKLLD